MRSGRCGRLDEHEPHDWLGPVVVPSVPRIPRHCTGHVVIEGGHP